MSCLLYYLFVLNFGHTTSYGINVRSVIDNVFFSFYGLFWLCLFFFFCFSRRIRHTRGALVTGVKTCALPICGIGSGKSRVADLFADWGAAVIDTDVIAHELTSPGGAAIESIRHEFGPDIISPTGALDRQAMRDLVFESPQARQRSAGRRVRQEWCR